MPARLRRGHPLGRGQVRQAAEVLRLNAGDEKFDVGYNAAQLKASEIIAVLLEVAKTMILKDMGYID